MENGQLIINGEKAREADIKDLISISSYDGFPDKETYNLMDDDVKRSAKFNEVMLTNMLKRVIAFKNKKSAKRMKKEKILHDLFKTKTNIGTKQKVYFEEYPLESDYSFLDEIVKSKKRVKGYGEYILNTIINHFYQYNRN